MPGCRIACVEWNDSLPSCNHRPTTPPPGLIDRGMPKLYALDLSDLPDANAADPADLASNCGRIGIGVERGDDHQALVRRNSMIAAARRDPGGKLDARLLGDFPDAGDTDAANLSGNGGRIGIDGERRKGPSAFFLCEFVPWQGRVTGLGLRNTPAAAVADLPTTMPAPT